MQKCVLYRGCVHLFSLTKFFIKQNSTRGAQTFAYDCKPLDKINDKHTLTQVAPNFWLQLCTNGQIVGAGFLDTNSALSSAAHSLRGLNAEKWDGWGVCLNEWKGEGWFAVLWGRALSFYISLSWLIFFLFADLLRDWLDRWGHGWSGVTAVLLNTNPILMCSGAGVVGWRSLV